MVPTISWLTRMQYRVSSNLDAQISRMSPWRFIFRHEYYYETLNEKFTESMKYLTQGVKKQEGIQGEPNQPPRDSI